MTDFESPYFAAIDLGSNSFHMIISRINENTVETVDKVKDMVQIARGMEGNELAEDSQARALECLTRFGERLRDIPASQIRAVGTKSLRSARNAKSFLRRAEKSLGHPIAIISGYEEARLVYKGLAHCVASDRNRRLVVDIGGASTEFIIGINDDPELLESLSLGCVVFAERFKLRKPNGKSMREAYLAACTELEQIRSSYLHAGWQIAYGTSGTMRAVAELVSGTDGGAVITASSMRKLYDDVVADSETTLQSQAKLRRDVLPSGIAIMMAIFDEFKIEKIHVADATLKDGLLYDTIGRLSNVDARHAAVAKLQKQYLVDTSQAERVSRSAIKFWRQVGGPELPGVSRTKILSWAAKLHEVGLGISHSSHHHHSYYILRHSDLAGFGRYEQHILAHLVRAHRKKVNEERFAGLEDSATQAILPMLVCLRLAVVLHRRREDLNHSPSLRRQDRQYTLRVARNWLAENPLTAAGLEREARYFQGMNIKLNIEDSLEQG